MTTRIRSHQEASESVSAVVDGIDVGVGRRYEAGISDGPVDGSPVIVEWTAGSSKAIREFGLHRCPSLASLKYRG